MRQLVVTGTAIAQPSRNIKPGFNIVGGMGVGLKAGAGFRVFAAMEFADFSRFVARSVDALVDGASREAASGLPSADATSRALLDAARPVFKIALRTAYELGEFIALNAPQADAAGAEQVSLRCAQVALEESQRFLLEGLADAALQALRTAMLRLDGPATRTRAGVRHASLRRALSDHLDGFPRRAVRRHARDRGLLDDAGHPRHRPRPRRWPAARSTSRRSASSPFCGRPRSLR